MYGRGCVERCLQVLTSFMVQGEWRKCPSGRKTNLYQEDMAEIQVNELFTARDSAAASDEV